MNFVRIEIRPSGDRLLFKLCLHDCIVVIFTKYGIIFTKMEAMSSNMADTTQHGVDLNPIAWTGGLLSETSGHTPVPALTQIQIHL